MSKPRSVAKTYLQPKWIMLAVSLVLLLTTLFFTQEHRSYNSDDVTWQVIVHGWHPFSGQKITLGGTNNFVDKLPFFEFMEHVFPAGRKLLFLEAASLIASGFTLFYLAGLYFLRKARVPLTYTNLLPFAWLATFGYSFSELYLNPIWRGFEIGVSFVTFMLAAMICYKDIDPFKSTRNKVLGVAASMVVGIMIYSDPYYLYFTVGPIVLFTAALFLAKKIGQRELASIYGGTALGLIFAKITGLISEAAGIHMSTTYPAVFVGFDQLPGSVWTGLHGLLTAFGGDFFGGRIFTVATFQAAVNFCILGFILYVIYKLSVLARRAGVRRLSDIQLWTGFFGLLGGIVFAVYVLSSLVNASTYRYLIILVYGFVLLLALTLHGFGTARRIVTGLLAAAILLNLAGSVRGGTGFMQEGNIGSVRNSANYALIQTAEDRGLTKGYANYWQGSINTYLSRNRAAFLPTECKNGHTSKMHWLINESAFNRPTVKSFFVIDPDVISLPTCTEEQLERQLGLPSQKVIVGDKTMLIFNYDIGRRL